MPTTFIDKIPAAKFRARGSEGECLIVGEVAQAHDGSLGTAHAFIDAIAKAGADAVKFQTHVAREESTPGEPWRVKFSPQDETRFDYWKRMEFTEEQWAGLKRHADDRGLIFISSPFSRKAVEILRRAEVSVWKIASGEVGNVNLLDNVIETRLPVMLSSGMSGFAELDGAVERVKNAGVPLAVLQCTTSYPCPPERIGLNLISELASRYGCAVGLSDHSGTIYPSLAAVTLGARVIEVHVTLSREMFGPDVTSSVTSGELGQLVAGVRFVEKMIANPVNKDAEAERLAPLRRMFTKSVVALQDLPEKTLLSAEHLTLKKPGYGIPAARMGEVVGQRLRRSVKADELLSFDDLEEVRL